MEKLNVGYLIYVLWECISYIVSWNCII